MFFILRTYLQEILRGVFLGNVRGVEKYNENYAG